MKANELRIGNYINQIKYFNGYCNEIRKIASVNKEGFLNVEVLGQHTMKSHPIKWFIGIPLSEEILLKCGFIANGGGVYELKDNWFAISVTGFTVKAFWYETKHQDVELRWFHQLQNIVFFNTGQELNTTEIR